MKMTHTRTLLLLAPSLLAPACVLATDFEEDDTSAATDANTDSGSDGHEASDSDTDPLDMGPIIPTEQPVHMWSEVLSDDSEARTDYIGVALGSAGEINAVGLRWGGPPVPGASLFHRYDSEGNVLLNAEVPLPEYSRLNDACMLPTGGLMALMETSGPGDGSLADRFSVVEFTPEGAVVANHPYTGTSSGTLNTSNTFPRIACDDVGQAWLALSDTEVVIGTRILRFDGSGMTAEQWIPDRVPTSIVHDGGTIHTMLANDTDTLWMRLDTSGAEFENTTIPERIYDFDVRGAQVLLRGRVPGLYPAQWLALTDLAGAEQWRVEQIDGAAFEGEVMSLGPSGATMVASRIAGPDSGPLRLTRIGPNGAETWHEEFSVPGEENPEATVFALGMEIDSDGSIVVVGGNSWPTPNVERAWITRYELQ